MLIVSCLEADGLGLDDLGTVVGKLVGTGWAIAGLGQVAVILSKNLSHCQLVKFMNPISEIFSLHIYHSSSDIRQLLWRKLKHKISR